MQLIYFVNPYWWIIDKYSQIKLMKLFFATSMSMWWIFGWKWTTITKWTIFVILTKNFGQIFVPALIRAGDNGGALNKPHHSEFSWGCSAPLGKKLLDKRKFFTVVSNFFCEVLWKYLKTTKKKFETIKFKQDLKTSLFIWFWGKNFAPFGRKTSCQPWC